MKKGIRSSGNNVKILRNTVSRDRSKTFGLRVAGYEDHGIYVLESTNALVRNNHVTGWSDMSGSGGSLKIKGVIGINVEKNRFFDAGIIVRKGTLRNENIWIHENEYDHEGSWAVHFYAPGNILRRVRIEKNERKDGTWRVVAIHPAIVPDDFNLAVSIMGISGTKQGGVFNNNFDMDNELMENIRTS